MPWFRNYYRCARCGREWTDEWSATCDDDCPRCGARHMSPYRSEDIPSPKQSPKTQRIAQLNDKLRRTLQGGEVIMTMTVDALPETVKMQALAQLASFSDFSDDNDPHGEHDFGSFELFGQKFLWKIDYYNALCLCASEDPSDPDKTTRVLTLMLADDY